MKKTRLAPIFVYLHHAVALTVWRADGFLDWPSWAVPPHHVWQPVHPTFPRTPSGLCARRIWHMHSNPQSQCGSNVTNDSAVCCFPSILNIYSRMCLRERIHLLNLATQTTDVTHIEAGEKLQATSPNGSPRCLTKQRDWRDTIICSFERKYQGLTKYCLLWGVQVLRLIQTLLISSNVMAMLLRLQLLHTPMTASAWNVLLPFEVIKLGISLTT